jgi:hypothetical protein
VPPRVLDIGRLLRQPVEQTLEGRHQRGVGHVALELVELAGEEPDSAPEMLAQLPDEGRLADARCAREHDPLTGARPDPCEDGLEPGQLALASVESLRDGELPGGVEPAELERFEHAGGPLVPAGLLEIGQEGVGALVALLGHLGEQLEHDRREELRDLGVGVNGR